MPKEISPSEYEQMVASGKASGSQSPGNYKMVAVVAVAVILCGLSFLGGVQYQKGHGPKQTGAQAGTGFQGRGGFGSGQRPTIGTVTAVASDSLTIKNNRTGDNQTFKISSTTTVSNNGSTGAVSDIQTGATVFVQTSTSDTSTATRIILNPSFNGQGGDGTTQQ